MKKPDWTRDTSTNANDTVLGNDAIAGLGDLEIGSAIGIGSERVTNFLETTLDLSVAAPAEQTLKVTDVDTVTTGAIAGDTISQSGSNIVFHNTYGSGVTAAYHQAVIDAEHSIQSKFSAGSTVDLYANFDFSALGGQVGGQNTFDIYNESYSAWRGQVAARSTSIDDAAAVAALPTTDPTGGLGVSMPLGYARMLGISVANTPDAIVLNSDLNFNFTDGDAAGVLEHELTEGAMGRVSSLGFRTLSNGTTHYWEPMDFYRFTAGGARDYMGGKDAVLTYFGFDSTHVFQGFQFHNSINSSGQYDGNDLADWDYTIADAFGPDVPGSPGTISSTDLRVMDVLGWGRIAPADDFPDDATTTGVVAVGGYATGELELKGDHDWFRVQLTAGVQYTIDEQGSPTNAGSLPDPLMALYNGSGKVASNDDSGGSFNSHITYTPTSSGAYYIEAGASGNQYAGTYRVTVSMVTSSVAINDVSVAEGDSGTKLLTFTVTRSGGTAAFDVQYATTDGTATTADTDYVASTGTVHFAAGDITKTISITVNGDIKVEPDETLSISLSNPTNGTTISDATGVGTILNDDQTSSVAINDVSVTEGDSGTKLLTFTVTRSGGTAAFDVQYATTDGTATTADTDYVASTGTVHFAAGDITKTISITVNGDIKVEPDETLSISLSNPTNGTTISDATGVGTILNDDQSVRRVLDNFGTRASAGSWTSYDFDPRLLGDVDGDGKADIVGFGADGIFVSLASGGGNFAAPALELHSFGTSAAAGSWTSYDFDPRLLGDVNGDGKADIVGFGADGVYVSLATGGGNFAAPVLELHSFGTSVAAGSWTSYDFDLRLLGDVNGDGKADIVGFGADGVYVSLATGGGNFAAPVLELPNFGTSAAAGSWTSYDFDPRLLGDVNGDGKADIVGFGADGVYVSLATGGGKFAAPVQALTSFGTNAASGSWTSQDQNPRELADVNGDGKADILGFGSDGIYTALGNSSGRFDPPVFNFDNVGITDAAGWQSQRIDPRYAADVTGDGRADFVGFGADGVLVGDATILYKATS